MRERKTIAQRLYDSKAALPPAWLYHILAGVTAVLNKLDNTHFIYNARPAESKEPFVFVSNHATRADFKFTGPPCYPKRLNYIVGYNEFFRFPTNILFRLMHVIPKKNFTPDSFAMRQILRIKQLGGNICFMPEGMNSITGMAQPVVVGTGKLLKKLGMPVYYSKISGGYLTYTKHFQGKRRGRIEVSVNRMFTAEQLKQLTPEQIEDTMNRLLAHDDYIWNKERQQKYNGRGRMAEKLETLLYLCPKCGKLYTMKSEGNILRCEACGNAVELDECYNLNPIGDSVCPELVTDWTIMERERAAAEVRKDGFVHSGQVKLGVLPEYRPLLGSTTSIIKGEGTLTLSREGLSFSGTLEGKPYEFRLPGAQVPSYGMCTDISRFYTFVDGRFIEFYPDDGDILLWMHLTEELHRAQGGKWQNTEYRHSLP